MVFLKQVAAELFAQFGDEFYKVQVVLPTRRACMYFKQYLVQVAGKNMLAPDVLSFSDFVNRYSGLEAADSVAMLFELYEVYRSYDQHPENTLEKFAPLGTTILRDFSVIDNNLTAHQASQLFDYLHEAKAVERWAEDLGKDFELKKNSSIRDYFDFWSNLKKTYQTFRAKLLKEGRSYAGLANRVLLENIDKVVTDNQLIHIAFVGFTQFTKVEEQLIARLVKLQKGSLWLDTDPYFFDNRVQEAADSLRKIVAKIPETHCIRAEKTLSEAEKHIEIFSVSTPLAQTKLLGELLHRQMLTIQTPAEVQAFKATQNFMAVLLPDESMLLPVLHSLPDETYETPLGESIKFIDYLNVTMGLSFHNTPFYTLIENIFSLQENMEMMDEGTFRIHYRDFLLILRHPFIQYSKKTQFFEAVQSHIAEVQKKNMIYIHSPQIQEWAKTVDFYEVIFRPWNDNPKTAFTYFNQLTALLSGMFDPTYNILENEYLLEFYKALKKIEKSIQPYYKDLNVRVFRQIFYEAIRSISIPFTGEPISPVQLMGTMESRCLDFDHVYILSCNEGILPKGKVLDSLIPFDVRQQVGLPTFSDNDAAFAGTFFRLFHRAKHITLIYSEASVGGVMEKSRFLTQIELEMSQLPNIKVEKKQLSLRLPEKPAPELEVKKDKFLLQMIEERLGRGISPSAINTYIRNPLEFFEKSILKLLEPDLVEENMEVNTFGKVVHGVLENLLKPFVGKLVDEQQINQIYNHEEQIKTELRQLIAREGGAIVAERGMNYILSRVAKQLIESFLNKQAEEPEFYLLQLETFLSEVIFVELPNGRSIPVKIAGMTDRIDIQQNTIRIVDYKTGTFKPENLKAASQEILFRNHEKEKIVQLMIYKYLLIKNLQRNEIKNLPPNFKLDFKHVKSGFYFFRKMNDGFKAYELADEPTEIESFIAYVENFISILVNDMLNPEKPFAHEPSDFGFLEIDSLEF